MSISLSILIPVRNEEENVNIISKEIVGKINIHNYETDNTKNSSNNYENKEENDNLFSKLKKKQIEVNNENDDNDDNKNKIENDIKVLKKEIENINNKVDLILNIIKKN